MQSARKFNSVLLRFAAPILVVPILLGIVFCSPSQTDQIDAAAQNGDMERVKALLKDNPDLVSSKNAGYERTPLHFAALGGQKDVAELLLARKANVNAEESDGSTPLHSAAYCGHKDVAELLLASGANVNGSSVCDRTPLLMAAEFDHEDVAELLVANKADVNAKAVDGETPLLFAAQNGDKKLVELLLRNGAGVNTKDIRAAEVGGDTNITELLRQHGSR